MRVISVFLFAVALSMTGCGGGAEALDYPQAFYELIDDEAVSSAQVVAPIVERLIAPTSMIDVGGGEGQWLAVFQKHGVERVLCLDGEWIDPEKLVIDRQFFRAVDLNQDTQVEGTFDLAMSLEVGEHLNQESAPGFVRLLTDAAPVVLFSAAIPGQGGTHHINEQWPAYWRRLFEERDYVLTDPIRPLILGNRAVASHYRQNMVVYCRRSEIGRFPLLEASLLPPEHPGIEWIHIGVVSQMLEHRIPRVFGRWRGSLFGD